MSDFTQELRAFTQKHMKNRQKWHDSLAAAKTPEEKFEAMEIALKGHEHFASMMIDISNLMDKNIELKQQLIDGVRAYANLHGITLPD